MEIVFEPEPQADTRAAILEGLVAYNDRHTEGRYAPPHAIALALRDPKTQKPVGGLTARIAYSRMFVELLFVPDDLRGQGFGARLLGDAENIAREKGCQAIWLDTFSFQAPEFYKKLGYDEFAVIPDYPPGFSRHYLQKTLS